MADEPGQPTEEELRRQLEEELRRLKVSDVLVQTVYTVSSLGYGKLTAEDRDLPQAQLAIEALRALVPVLEGSVRDDIVRDLNQVRANMQLAYAKAVSESSSNAPPEAGGAAAGKGEDTAQAAGDDAP